MCSNGSFSKGSKRNIRIPSAMSSGQKLFFESEGHVHEAAKGNLIVTLKVKKDKMRNRDGLNVVESVPVTYSDLLLSKKIIARTVHGDRRVEIPFGTFDGDVLRIKSQGIKSKSKTGDHLLKMCLISPAELTEEQRIALEQLKKVGL